MTSGNPGFGCVIVVRPVGNYRDSLRAYTVMIDGTSVGKIMAGGEIRVDLDAGRHTISAKVDWTGSKRIDFSLRAGATTTFEVRPAGSTFLSVFQAVGRDTYLTVESLSNE